MSKPATDLNKVARSMLEQNHKNVIGLNVEIKALRAEVERLRKARAVTLAALLDLQDHHCSGACDNGNEHKRVMRAAHDAFDTLKGEKS